MSIPVGMPSPCQCFRQPQWSSRTHFGGSPSRRGLPAAGEQVRHARHPDHARPVAEELPAGLAREDRRLVRHEEDVEPVLGAEPGHLPHAAARLAPVALAGERAGHGTAARARVEPKAGRHDHGLSRALEERGALSPVHQLDADHIQVVLNPGPGREDHVLAPGVRRVLLGEEPVHTRRVCAERGEARLLEPRGEGDGGGERLHGLVLRPGVEIVAPCRELLDLLAVVAGGFEPAEQPIEVVEGRARVPIAVLRHEVEGREDAAQPIGGGLQARARAPEIGERREDASRRAGEVMGVVGVGAPEDSEHRELEQVLLLRTCRFAPALRDGAAERRDDREERSPCRHDLVREPGHVPVVCGRVRAPFQSE